MVKVYLNCTCGSEADVVCDNLMRNTQLRDNLKFATLHFPSLGHPGGIRPPGGCGHDMTCPYGAWGEQLGKKRHIARDGRCVFSFVIMNCLFHYFRDGAAAIGVGGHYHVHASEWLFRAHPCQVVVAHRLYLPLNQNR